MYSECPSLTSKLTVAFVTGVQNGNTSSAAAPPYLQAGSCCKHLIAYDVETNRFSFNANVDTRSFWEFYAPVFHACLSPGAGRANATHAMCSCE